MMKMQVYETMIVRQGMRNPKAKKNFFGDLPFSPGKMVHEKVAGLSPKSPQMPSKGGVIIRKLKSHEPSIMRTINGRR